MAANFAKLPPLLRRSPPIKRGVTSLTAAYCKNTECSYDSRFASYSSLQNEPP